MSFRRPRAVSPPAPSDEELLAGPHDRCQRCGRPTPLGVGMCDVCNPGHIGGASATQVHGTIVAGVGIGFLGLAILGRLLLAGVGPFPVKITQAAVQPNGALEVTLAVTNDGTREAAASCRVNRGGLNSSNDVFFLTDPIPPGATSSFTRTGAPPVPGDPPWNLARLSVTCQ